jgi:ABC-type siderophore export system fused ATPase/permease subunit
MVFEGLWGLGRADLDEQARRYLHELRLERVVRVTDGTFSTTGVSRGQRKRLALLTAYLEDRPVYVFDEWAAGQDPAFKAVFYRKLLPELRRRGKLVIVISHDRFFLDRICTHLLVFEGNGRTSWFVGNFADYEEQVLAGNADRLLHRRGKYKKLALR